jgi:hypothetical protein
MRSAFKPDICAEDYLPSQMLGLPRTCAAGLTVGNGAKKSKPQQFYVLINLCGLALVQKAVRNCKATCIVHNACSCNEYGFLRGLEIIFQLQ